jgi:hypothetical protein
LKTMPSLELSIRVVKSTNLLYQPLGEEAVILNLDNEQYFGLDETGVRLWQLLDQYHEPNAIFTHILAEYDVEEEDLRRDLATFIDELVAAGLVSVEPLSNG